MYCLTKMEMTVCLLFCFTLPSTGRKTLVTNRQESVCNCFGLKFFHQYLHGGHFIRLQTLTAFFWVREKVSCCDLGKHAALSINTDFIQLHSSVWITIMQISSVDCCYLCSQKMYQFVKIHILTRRLGDFIRDRETNQTFD